MGGHKFEIGDKASARPGATSSVGGYARDPEEVRDVVRTWDDGIVALRSTGEPGNVFRSEDLIWRPDQVRAGDTVTLVSPASVDRGTVPVPAKIEGVVREVLPDGRIAVHGVPGYFFPSAVTDHQPAPEPEPEYEPRKVYEHPNGDRFWSVNTEHGVMLVNEYGDTDHPADITQPLRPLVVIDPAAVEVDALAHAIEAERYAGMHDQARAALKFLGIVEP